MLSSTELIIEAGRAERHYWRDLWRYRELFYFLAWRDIAIRYKQTVVGVFWAVIRPLVTMVVFTIVFGRLAKFPSPAGVPYSLMVFTGMLPWTLFSSAFSGSSSSLVGNANLISKVYFPRLIIPASSVMVGFVEFLISLAMLAVLMAFYGVAPSWRIVFLPFFVLVSLAAAFGPALWIGALNVRYRDFGQIIPFLILLGTYISPVGMASSVVPAQFRLCYSLNPMVGVIDGFRWAVLGQSFDIYWPGFLLSLGMVAVLLGTGLNYFRRTEKTFADVI